MSVVLAYRLDKIENPECLKNPIEYIDNDFPTDLFSEDCSLSDEQIRSIAKMVVSKLHFNVMQSELVDIKKYLFNQYSKMEFINQDFFDLLASVLDYVKQFDIDTLDFTSNGNCSLINKAIVSTINAVTVLTVKRNPIIIKTLNNNQKADIKNLTNQTVKNVKTLDRKRSNDNSYSKGKNMSAMMKYMAMSKMMSKGDDGGSGNKMAQMMMLSQMMKKKSPVDKPLNNKNDQMMQMYQMMNGGGMASNPMAQMMGMGGSNNKMAQMAMMSQMMKKKSPETTSLNNKNDQMMQMYRMMNGGGMASNPMAQMMGMGSGTNAMKQQMLQNMLMKQKAQQTVDTNHAKLKAMMKMFNGGEQKNDGTNLLNMHEQSPQLADVYNDPDISINRANPDEQLEALRQSALQASANNERIEAMATAMQLEEDGETEDNVPDIEDDMDDPEFVNWINDVEEEEDDHDDNEVGELDHPFYEELEHVADGAVEYSEDFVESHPQIFEMFTTDTNSDSAIETITVNKEEMSEQEKWIQHMIKDQEEVIEKYFDGTVPEGVNKIEVDGVSYYAFTPETLFSGKYKTVETLKYYFAKGEKPPASAASLPLTIKGKNKVISILTSDGVRGDIIVPDIEDNENVDIDNHIPPKAIVEWRKLREKEIYDESGEKITDGLVVLDNELIGTINSASITANCFAISTEETDISNSNGRPIEYYVNDPSGFYVENVNEILDIFGCDKDIKDIKELIDEIKAAKNLHPGVLAHIDRMGTEALNDFLHYSMGLDVTIDSFIEDYDELLEVVDVKGSVPYIEYLNDYQKDLINVVCSVVRGDEVENLEVVGGEIERNETIDGNNVSKTVTFDGNDFDKNLVVFNNKTQVTEIPWTFYETGLNLVKQIDAANPFVMLNKNEDNEDIYLAISEIYDRATFDGETRKIILVTKDLVNLEIIKSAYDEETFIVVSN